jgi:hypothetical protein
VARCTAVVAMRRHICRRSCASARRSWRRCGRSCGRWSRRCSVGWRALRGELQELKTGKAWSDERIAKLEESECGCGGGASGEPQRAGWAAARVAKLEENNCEEHDELEEVPEADELDDYSQLPLNSARHRVQAPQQACTRVRDFQALSVAAMDACCPPNGAGHRRFLQAATCRRCAHRQRARRCLCRT